MKRLFIYFSIVALATALFAGCDGGGDGDGGSGGMGGGGSGGIGGGGMGGAGGAGLCEGIDCSDGVECTDDVCDPATGLCDNPTAPDGTPCSTGGCQEGACTSVFHCTEEGIVNAISAAAGSYTGPYTFACNVPTTVTTTSELLIAHDVILDGEGRLTVDGNDSHAVFVSWESDVAIELNRLAITGGATTNRGSGVHSRGALKMTDCTVSGNSGNYSSAISAFGDLTLTNTTVSDNAWNGIGTSGTATLNNCIVSRNARGGISNSGTLTLNDTTVSENNGDEGGGITNFGTLVVNDSAVSRNTAASGGGISSAFEEGVSVTLNRSTVSENTASGGCGGIDSWGTLILNKSIVSDNRAGGTGGICSTGSLALNLSTVSGNTATWPSSWGGGIASSGEATLVDSTISDNSATAGGGAFSSNGDLTIRGCTFFGNVAVHGGGINVQYGALTLENSTVSGNIALETGGGIHSRQEFILQSSTVAFNSADSGGAIFFASTSGATLLNSAIEGDCELEFGYMPSSSGGNIESPGDSCGLDNAGDQTNVTGAQLNLGPLQDNGGPTMTHSLLPGSVAIDKIPEAMCEVDTDQRSVGRPQGLACDVGAFELKQGGL